MNKRDIFVATATMVALGCILLLRSGVPGKERASRKREPFIDEGSDLAAARLRSAQQAIDDSRTPVATKGMAELVVEVESAGKPLESAQVALEFGTEVPVMRITGSDGTTGILIDGKSQCRIIVSKAGYAPAYRVVRPPFPAPVLVSLVKARQVKGRVLFADGSAPATVFTVVAWPSNRMPTVDEMRRTFHGARLFPTARTNSSGEFVMEGLDPEREYMLVAANGALCTPTAARVVPSAGEATVIVSTFYGAALDIRGDAGEFPVSSPILYSPGGVTCLDGDAHDWPRVPHSPLLGMLPAGTEKFEEISPFRLVCLFTSDKGKPAIGPVLAKVSIPGYRTRSVEFEVNRLDSQLSTQTVSLQQDTKYWSAIEINFSGAADTLQHTADWPPLVGHLRDLQANTMMEFDITDFRSSMFIGAVPQSTYDLSIGSLSGLPVFPARGKTARLIVGQGLCSTSVTLNGMCGARFSVTEGIGGDGYDGPMSVELEDSGGGSSYIFFLRSPYEMTGIPPGQYKATCTRRGCAAVIKTVLMRAGLVAELEIGG